MGRYIESDSLLTYVANDTADGITWADIAIDAAEDWIDKYTGRRYNVANSSTTPTARKYPECCDTLLPIDDCFEVTAISVGGSTVALASVELEPINGIDYAGEVWPTTGIVYSNGWLVGSTLKYPITITGRWGWPAIPAAITQAAYVLARDEMLLRRTLGNGYIGITDSFGLRAGENRSVTTLLTRYRKSWGIA